MPTVASTRSAELAAVPAVREADEVAEERRVRPLAALVRGDARELEQLVHLAPARGRRPRILLPAAAASFARASSSHPSMAAA